MQQPIRKKIKDTHPNSLPNIFTLLVDGTNLLKISMVDDKVNSRGEHIGGIFQFLLQLKKMIGTRDFDYVYVFFDDEHSGILRYNLYKPYKANRDKNYENASINLSPYMQEFNNRTKQMQNYLYGKNKTKEIDNQKDLEKLNFKRERDSLCEYFSEMYIRWMMDESTEVDDLISYYILNKEEREKVVIMSSDHDLTQLISPDVYIYNPRLKKNITHLNFKDEFGYIHENVVILKTFCGDNSDNISNISGLSKNKLFELIPEMRDRVISVDEVKERAKLLSEKRIKEKKSPFKYCINILSGVSNKEYDGDFYEINEKIIDLKKPLLTESAKNELFNMMHAPQDPEGRSIGNLYKLIIRDDITDLKDDNKFTSFFSTFKKIIDKEENFFNISLKK